MKRGPDPKLFLVLAIGAVLLGGGMSFMAFNGLSGAKEELRKLQSESKDAKTLANDLAISEASLMESSKKLEHLEKGVQTYAYVPTMLAELERLGKSCGISVTGVRPMPKQAAPKKEGVEEGAAPKRKAYDELDIEVRGRGNYRSVMNFIQALERFPKIVASRTVDMAPKSEPGVDSSTLEVTLNLRAYVFPTPDGNEKKKTAMVEGSNHEG